MPVKKASNPSDSNCSYRGIEYRLLPGTQWKAQLLAGLCGACRFVWNSILEQINGEVKDKDTENPSTSFYSLINRYPILRKETDWLSKYSSHIVRNTLSIRQRRGKNSSKEPVIILRSITSTTINPSQLQKERLRLWMTVSTSRRLDG